MMKIFCAHPILREGEELDGGEMIPGFRVWVGEIFEG